MEITLSLKKIDFVKKAARTLDIHPDIAKQVIQELMDQILKSLERGERIELRDFGIFDVVVRKAKVGRNPQNPSVDIAIPARKGVKFKAGKKTGSGAKIGRSGKL